MVINNFRWESFSMAPSWPKHLSQLTPAVGSLRVGSQDHLAAHPLRGADAARLTRKEQIAPMIGYIGYRTSFITMKSTWNPSEIVRFFLCHWSISHWFSQHHLVISASRPEPPKAGKRCVPWVKFVGFDGRCMDILWKYYGNRWDIHII